MRRPWQKDQEAGTSSETDERLRARAALAYRRADPVVCVLAGAVAGYVSLVIAGPWFLALAADNPGLDDP